MFQQPLPERRLRHDMQAVEQLLSRLSVPGAEVGQPLDPLMGFAWPRWLPHGTHVHRAPLYRIPHLSWRTPP